MFAGGMCTGLQLWVGKGATRTMENASVCRFLHTAVRRRLYQEWGRMIEHPWGLAGITLTGNENIRASARHFLCCLFDFSRGPPAYGRRLAGDF